MFKSDNVMSLAAATVFTNDPEKKFPEIIKEQYETPISLNGDFLISKDAANRYKGCNYLKSINDGTMVFGKLSPTDRKKHSEEVNIHIVVENAAISGN